ncbi:MAG: hypothetical protein VZT48_02665 [Bulleidia sp.]|nr:hypothetical protein [Bulleidia sp.]
MRKVRKILCLCAVLLCAGCSTVKRDMQTDLNQRIAEVSSEAAHVPVYAKGGYSYYVQPSIGRIESTRMSNVFMKDGTKFVMNLNVPQIINDQYYQSMSAADTVNVNAVIAAETEGTYIDHDDQEHAFSLKIYQLDENFYTWLETDTVELFSVSGQLKSLQLAEEFLRIARTVHVNDDAVAAEYSKKTTISYTRKKLQLFQNIAPESGSVQELFENNQYAGSFQDPFGDNYGENTSNNGTITSDEVLEDGDTEATGTSAPMPSPEETADSEEKQS